MRHAWLHFQFFKKKKLELEIFQLGMLGYSVRNFLMNFVVKISLFYYIEPFACFIFKIQVFCKLLFTNRYIFSLLFLIYTGTPTPGSLLSKDNNILAFQHARYPPSTGRVVPLIIEARSLRRNTTASTTSSTSTQIKFMQKQISVE